MSFDVLLAVYAALTLLALVRLRPAIFVFAGNQLLALRALALVAEHGQPRSQSFLFRSVFSHDNLEIAAVLFTLQLVPLIVFVALPDAKGPSTQVPVLPALPRWACLALGGYFLALIASSRTIFTHTFTDPARRVFGLNLGGGAHALLASAVLYEVVRRSRGPPARPLAGFLFLLLLFSATDYIKGSTGLATGYLVAGALLLFREELRPRRRLPYLAGALACTVLIAYAVREVRASFSLDPDGTLATAVDTLSGQESRVAQSAEGLESIGNGTQYAAHVVECISLREAGISREWRSIYEPVLNTLKPAFLLEPLGLTRAKEPAWELADYYIHGGGVFVLGELYWNGGYLCVMVISTLLLWVCWRSDTRSRHSVAWLIFLCSLAPNLLMGVGYGFSQISRGAINGLIAIGIWMAWRAAGRRWALKAR